MFALKLQTGTNNTILREVAEAVAHIDAEVGELITRMKKIMRKEGGIGLAAPQVGISLRVILVTLEKEVFPMINPEILSFSAECKIDEEGCLSLPKVFDRVSRSQKIRLRYLDLDGNSHERELMDLDARVVQHEVDHLDGILFVDRVQKNQMLFS